MNDLPPGWIGYLLALLTAALAFLVNWRKGKVDESALILGQWREMVEQHAVDIKDLREELRLERASGAEMRRLMAEMTLKHAEELQRRDEQTRKRDQRIAELEHEVMGLKRQIAQNSQSTAMMIGGHARRARGIPSPEDEEAARKLDRAGDNSVPKGDGK